MKTIYVTIAEFEEHGGVLEIDRDLFSRKNADAPFKIVGVYDGFFEDKDWPDLVRIKDGRGTYPVYKNQTFIQIQCTPIYK